MIKVALCDGNNDSITYYAELITKIAQKNRISIELSCFNSAESMLFHHTDTNHVIDIIYIDVMQNRIATAKEIRAYNRDAQIIFLTDHADYVYEAFEMDAVQYLIKQDTTDEKFETVFLKTAEIAAKKHEDMFSFEFDGKTSLININEISYFEIWKRIVTVHYENEKTAKFYSSMEQLENKLSGKNFIRVHRSYLVNMPYITSLQHNNLLLKDGETIPVGITYIQSSKKAFADYIFRFHIYVSADTNGKK